MQKAKTFGHAWLHGEPGTVGSQIQGHPASAPGKPLRRMHTWEKQAMNLALQNAEPHVPSILFPAQLCKPGLQHSENP